MSGRVDPRGGSPDPGSPNLSLESVRRDYDRFKRDFDSQYLFWRWIMTPVPILVTVPLARLGVSPNSITVASVVIGLVGCVSLGMGERLVGVLLVLSWQVLDCVDGLVAQVLGRQSRVGAFLDTSGAHVMYAGFFLTWGVGLAVQPDSALLGFAEADRELLISIGMVLSGGVAALAVTLRSLLTAEYHLAQAGSARQKAASEETTSRSLGGAYRWLHRNLLEFMGFFLPLFVLAHALGLSSAMLVLWMFAWCGDLGLSVILHARHLTRSDRGVEHA